MTTPSNARNILEFTYVPPPAAIASKSELNKFNNTREFKDLATDLFPNPANNYVVVYNYKDASDRTIEIYILYG